MATGKCTMISRKGELRTFHKPGSRFSLRAANSNRALCASQGLISWSNVTAGGTVDIDFSNSNFSSRLDVQIKPHKPKPSESRLTGEP